MGNAGRRAFVDRERELAELRQIADRGGPAITLPYGRRRVGKTYLLDHAVRFWYQPPRHRGAGVTE